LAYRVSLINEAINVEYLENLLKTEIGFGMSNLGGVTSSSGLDGRQRISLHSQGFRAYFTHLKCQKHIGDDVGDFKDVFTNKKKKLDENDPLIRFIHLIMQEYDSKCLNMYLITLTV
jgi:hypothetical protein